MQATASTFDDQLHPIAQAALTALVDDEPEFEVAQDAPERAFARIVAELTRPRLQPTRLKFDREGNLVHVDFAVA